MLTDNRHQGRSNKNRPIDERRLVNAALRVPPLTKTASQHFVLAEQEAAVFAVAAALETCGGSEASEFVSNVLTNELMETPVDCSFDIRQAKSAFRRAVRVALDGMREIANACPELSDMGTSVLLGWFIRERLYYLHIGACRLYGIRNDSIHRVSANHLSTVKHEHQAMPSVLRFIGPSSDNVRADVGAISLEPGDRYLFLSESIAAAIPDQALLQAAKFACTPMETCHWLTRAAHHQNPVADVSCVVVDYANDQ